MPSRTIQNTAALVLVLLPAIASAEELLREVDWASAKPAEGIVEVLDGTSWLRLENEGDDPRAFRLTVLESPEITQPRYALAGEVRYEGVQGEGYLEMWNVFPDGSRYFTRSMAPSGPLKRLSGDEKGRYFVLPFTILSSSNRPVRLEVNVHLPGKGTVWVGPLRLFQYDESGDPSAVPGAWWSLQTGIWLGALGGSLLGIFAGLLGWLGARGRARSLVLGGMAVMIGVGAFLLVLGIVGFALGQPYEVAYPAALLGAIAVGVGLPRFFALRKSYQEQELRKMEAMDAQ